eukprot:29571-Pelagococcus_subviridis.AAC.2
MHRARTTPTTPTPAPSSITCRISLDAKSAGRLRVEGPYERMSGRRGRGLKARCGRREMVAKVLKDRRSPRRRGRTGTSVRQNAPHDHLREVEPRAPGVAARAALEQVPACADRHRADLGVRERAR